MRNKTNFYSLLNVQDQNSDIIVMTWYIYPQFLWNKLQKQAWFKVAVKDSSNASDQTSTNWLSWKWENKIQNFCQPQIHEVFEDCQFSQRTQKSTHEFQNDA